MENDDKKLYILSIIKSGFLFSTLIILSYTITKLTKLSFLNSFLISVSVVIILFVLYKLYKLKFKKKNYNTKTTKRKRKENRPISTKRKKDDEKEEKINNENSDKKTNKKDKDIDNLDDKNKDLSQENQKDKINIQENKEKVDQNKKQGSANSKIDVTDHIQLAKNHGDLFGIVADVVQTEAILKAKNILGKLLDENAKNLADIKMQILDSIHTRLYEIRNLSTTQETFMTEAGGQIEGLITTEQRANAEKALNTLLNDVANAQAQGERGSEEAMRTIQQALDNQKSQFYNYNANSEDATQHEAPTDKKEKTLNTLLNDVANAQAQGERGSEEAARAIQQALENPKSQLYSGHKINTATYIAQDGATVKIGETTLKTLLGNASIQAEWEKVLGQKGQFTQQTSTSQKSQEQVYQEIQRQNTEKSVDSLLSDVARSGDKNAKKTMEQYFEEKEKQLKPRAVSDKIRY
jgi:hypothetical protein